MSGSLTARCTQCGYDHPEPVEDDALDGVTCPNCGNTHWGYFDPANSAYVPKESGQIADAWERLGRALQDLGIPVHETKDPTGPTIEYVIQFMSEQLVSKQGGKPTVVRFSRQLVPLGEATTHRERVILDVRVPPRPLDIRIGGDGGPTFQIPAEEVWQELVVPQCVETPKDEPKVQAEDPDEKFL